MAFSQIGAGEAAVLGIKYKGTYVVRAASNITLSGEQTVDGEALVDGDLCAVTDQTNGVENGLYIVRTGAWDRTANLAVGSSAAGSIFQIEKGTYAEKGYLVTNDTGNDIVGTDALTFDSWGAAVGSPVSLISNAVDETPLTIKAFTGQTANLLDILDDGGSNLCAVTALGNIDSDMSLTAATGDEVGVDIALTVNKLTSGNYTGINLNVTETSAPGSSNYLMDLQVGSSTKFSVDNAGAVAVTAAAETALTASTEKTTVSFDLSHTQQWATGALVTQREMRIQAPTYAFVGASTITTASTVSISGAPIAGTNATITNSYALQVESGITKFPGTSLVNAAGDFTNPGGQTSAEVFGAGASVTAANANAFGNSAIAGQWGNAFGYNAHATGNGAVSIGYGNATGSSGAYAIGIGHLTTANGDYSIILGEQGIAGGNNHVFVVGRQANATAANQIVFGDVQGPFTAMYIGEGVTSTTPQAILISATGGSGAGVAGSTMTIAGGAAGSGDADGGGITLSPAAASGAGTKGVLTLDYAAFPAADAAGFLKSDGAGNLSWDSSSVDIGDAISGSSANRILYMNGSNVLANSSAFTFDGTDVVLTGASRNFSAPGAQTDSEKFGVGAVTGGAKATAFGKNTSAYKDSAAFGYGAGGSSNNITAIGVLATCSGAGGGIALGYSASAGNKALALGYDISAGTDSMKMAWGSATWVNGDSAGKVTFGGAVTATGAFIASSTVQFADVAYTFPNDAAGYLKSDGAGTLSWDSSAVDIGDTITSATNYSVLHINDSGALAQTANYTMTSGVLNLPGALTTTVGGLAMDASGNTTLGLGQLADAATDGFSYMSTTTSGVPSGTPTTKTGYSAVVVDDTNHNLMYYSGGSWRSAGDGISNVVEDTSPQLGGSLDVNGNAIVSVSDGDIQITPDGSGRVILDVHNWPTADAATNAPLVTDGAASIVFGDTLLIREITTNTGYDFRLGVDSGYKVLMAVNSVDIFELNGDSLILDANCEIGSADAFYIGDQSTDGSWRIIRSGNDIEFERRESAAWVSKGSFTAA